MRKVGVKGGRGRASCSRLYEVCLISTTIGFVLGSKVDMHVAASYNSSIYRIYDMGITNQKFESHATCT